MFFILLNYLEWLTLKSKTEPNQLKYRRLYYWPTVLVPRSKLTLADSGSVLRQGDTVFYGFCLQKLHRREGWQCFWIVRAVTVRTLKTTWGRWLVPTEHSLPFSSLKRILSVWGQRSVWPLLYVGWEVCDKFLTNVL